LCDECGCGPFSTGIQTPTGIEELSLSTPRPVLSRGITPM